MEPALPDAGCRRARYQHHHLLPLALLRRPQLAAFLEGRCRLTDRRSNCIWLPANEALAARSGSALHRGPHPQYTDIVAHRVDRIRQASDAGTGDLCGQGDVGDRAIIRLNRLQRVLARVLLGDGPRLLHLNRKDPLRLFADYSYLDRAIDQLATARVDGPVSPPVSGDG